MVEALKLKPKGYESVMAFGGIKQVGIYEISLGLPNGKIYHDVKVYGAENDEYAALIGMDIISETDFLITNENDKTSFFRFPSEGGVEIQ